MPAKPSLEPRKSTIRQTQKNGDIYVLERVIQYDPEKKYNRVLSTTLNLRQKCRIQKGFHLG